MKMIASANNSAYDPIVLLCAVASSTWSSSATCRRHATANPTVPRHGEPPFCECFRLLRHQPVSSLVPVLWHLLAVIFVAILKCMHVICVDNRQARAVFVCLLSACDCFAATSSAWRACVALDVSIQPQEPRWRRLAVACPTAHRWWVTNKLDTFKALHEMSALNDG